MAQNIDAAKWRNKGLSAKLLTWYARHARELPWRALPGHAGDPYAIWLSEIMLQQTTVAAVKGYYAAFLARWPTVGALAAAPLDDVLAQWAGLGYYARARNLHACAQVVAERGGFPDSVAGLRELPGIGPYTAGAIAAIAFNRPAAAVDGNVERVIARLYAIETPLPEAKSEITALTQALVPHAAPGDFAQSLMDLGATICTPRAPQCLICPWLEDCQARAKGLTEVLPRKAAKRAVPQRVGIAFWITSPDGQVLLRRRANKGLLGGMMEIPSTLWAATLPADPFAEAPAGAGWRDTGRSISHTFTHFHLSLAIWSCEVTDDAPANCRWAPLHSLENEALPTVMRKIVQAMG